ncbi:PilW family protein [Thermopirellula anaerolimosa]
MSDWDLKTRPTSTAVATGAPRRRKAITLLEILIAVGIAAMILTATAALVKTSEDAFTENTDQAQGLQSGRLCLERIRRLFSESFANELFPGARVVGDLSPSGTFPECLVLWHPEQEPAEPDGRPRVCELIFFYPNPAQPNEVLEVTVPHRNNPAPEYEDGAAWRNLVKTVKLDGLRKTVTWSDQLRTFEIDGVRRGALRFQIRLRPSSAEWNDSTVPWEAMAWPQGLFSPQTGMRHVWLAVELQIQTRRGDASASGAVPLFGSVGRMYVLRADRR